MGALGVDALDGAAESEQAEPLEGEHIPGEQREQFDRAYAEREQRAQDEQREKVQQAVKRLWRVGTSKLCPLWEIADSECDVLAEATVPVLEKYFPDFRWPVELNAAFALVLVFGPRWGTPAHPSQVKPDDEAEPNAGGDGRDGQQRDAGDAGDDERASVYPY